MPHAGGSVAAICEIRQSMATVYSDQIALHFERPPLLHIALDNLNRVAVFGNSAQPELIASSSAPCAVAEALAYVENVTATELAVQVNVEVHAAISTL